MKFKFDRDAMIKEISIAQEIITNKNPVSILSNVLLVAESNTLTIKASDSSINFITKIPVEIEEEGTTTIYCDKFMSILSSSPSGEIEFEQDDINVTIKPLAKKVKFDLRSISSEKYPEINKSEGLTYFDIPAAELKEMIHQTSFSVSDDERRYFMTGVYLEKKGDNIVMVSTDGRRLSYVEKNLGQSISDFPPTIIPTKVLNCIYKNSPSEGNISVAVIDKLIFFKFGNYEFSSLSIEGSFPNYQRVIPETQERKFQVDKAELEGALKRISIMIDKKILRIIFKINSGSLTIIGPESEFGKAEEEIPCQYDGDEMVIGFNYKYIEEPLKFSPSERINFEFTEPTKPITIRNEPNSDYFHIVMPMTY